MVTIKYIVAYEMSEARPSPNTSISLYFTKNKQRPIWIIRPIICATIGIEACWTHVRNLLLKSNIPKKKRAGIIGFMYAKA